VEDREARKEEFRLMRRKIILASQSHHSLKDRARVLIALHDRAVERHMVFHPGVYELFFNALLVASHPSADGSVASDKFADAAARARLHPLPKALVDATARPDGKGNTYRDSDFAAMSASTFSPYVDSAWSIFEFMVTVGVDITTQCAEDLMRLLAVVKAPSPTIEGRAHQVMMRLDTLRLVPTSPTLADYYRVCDANDCMHIAVARFADARLRHEIIPSPKMCTTIIMGLVRNRQTAQAMRFIGCLGGVAVDQPMINACMEAARRTEHPLAAFDMWRTNATSLPSGIRLDAPGLSILLRAWRVARTDAEAASALRPSEAPGARRAPVFEQPVPHGSGRRLAEIAYLFGEIRRAGMKLDPATSHKLAVSAAAAVVDVGAIAWRRARKQLGTGATEAEVIAKAAKALPPQTAFVLRAGQRISTQLQKSPASQKATRGFLKAWDAKLKKVESMVLMNHARPPGAGSPPGRDSKGRLTAARASVVHTATP
jgi:hypothetical protein